MKLLHCPECKDTFNLTIRSKVCSCKKTKGMYLNKADAIYTGIGIPLGLLSEEYYKLADLQQETGRHTIDAFVIAKDCATYRKVSSIEYNEVLINNYIAT